MDETPTVQRPDSSRRRGADRDGLGTGGVVHSTVEKSIPPSKPRKKAARARVRAGQPQERSGIKRPQKQLFKKPDFQYLDSYNRESSLESPRARWLYWLANGLLLTLGAIELSPWPLGLGSLQVLQWSIPLVPFGVAMLLIVYRLSYRQRVKNCRHCGRELQLVMRPVTLRNELLTRPGIVQDGVFYSLVGYLPMRRKWMKLRQQSQACHHCRLYENRHFKSYEPLTDDEEQKLKSALDKQY